MFAWGERNPFESEQWYSLEWKMKFLHCQSNLYHCVLVPVSRLSQRSSLLLFIARNCWREDALKVGPLVIFREMNQASWRFLVLPLDSARGCLFLGVARWGCIHFGFLLYAYDVVGQCFNFSLLLRRACLVSLAITAITHLLLRIICRNGNVPSRHPGVDDAQWSLFARYYSITWCGRLASYGTVWEPYLAGVERELMKKMNQGLLATLSRPAHICLLTFLVVPQYSDLMLDLPTTPTLVSSCLFGPSSTPSIEKSPFLGSYTFLDFTVVLDKSWCSGFFRFHDEKSRGG